MCNLSKIDLKIGIELAKLLKEKRINQRLLAALMGWGFDNVSQKMNGKRAWKVEHLHLLCQKLKTEIVISGTDITFEPLNVETDAIIEYPDVDINDIVGKELQNLLLDNLYTQQALSTRLGKSPNFIHIKIHNKRFISADLIYMICAEMNVTCVMDGTTIKFYDN